LVCAVAGLLSAQSQTTFPGVWHFVMDTQGGERQIDATFQLDGTNVTGKWDKADVKGTFAGGKLNLAFPLYSEEGGFSATLKIIGTLEGGELKGTWEFGEHTGTYRAKKKE
jgi:hypothetical protein